MEMLVDLRLNGVVGRLPCNLLEMKFSARLLVLIRLPALLPNVRLHCGNGKKVFVVVEKREFESIMSFPNSLGKSWYSNDGRM